jgi:NADP-dependent 3-hydroxy acid dehydrogenase YdfG
VGRLGHVAGPGRAADRLRAGREPSQQAAAREIAAIISFCVSRPRTVSVNEVLVRPAAQGVTGRPAPVSFIQNGRG